MSSAPEAGVQAGGYRVDVGDACADRELVLGLWQRCGFGGSVEQNAARYDWFYLQNPQGRGRLYLLRQPGSTEVVGSVGVIARRFDDGSDRPLQSGALVDFVVHPAHRSLYPALLLQRKVCELEFQQREFVYGLPVAKAVPVVERLAGAVRFTSGTYVRIIRSSAYIRKRVPWLPLPFVTLMAALVDVVRGVWVRLMLALYGVRGQQVALGELDLRALMRRIATDEAVTIGDRGPEVLAWRARAPGRNVDVAAVRRSRTGEVIGYAMYALEGGSLVVLDFLAPREDRLAHGMWLALCRCAMSVGATVVRVEFAGLDRVAVQMRKAGYFHRASRPGYVIAGEPSSPNVAKCWWFTRFDEDV